MLNNFVVGFLGLYDIQCYYRYIYRKLEIEFVFFEKYLYMKFIYFDGDFVYVECFNN